MVHRRPSFRTKAHHNLKQRSAFSPERRTLIPDHLLSLGLEDLGLWTRRGLLETAS